MNYKKTIIFLIILGLLIFGLRLFNLNESIYNDEAYFAYSLTTMDHSGFNGDFSSPSLLNIIYKPLLWLFGLQTWVFRLVPWLFGIINTLLVYLLAKRNFGERATFWSTLLMLVAFYPTLASLQFDVEGNLIMFSVLLLFFSYLEYENAVQKKDRRKAFGWQLLTGLGLGIAIATKYNSIYLVVVLLFYSLIQRKWSIKKSFNDLFLIYLTGLMLFLVVITSAIISSPQQWLNFVPIISWADGFSAKYQPQSFSLLGIAMYLLWSTPLLIGFYFTGLFGKWKDNNDQKVEKYSSPRLLFLLWISISLLFYTVVITYGSFDRYFMNTIPALALLGGLFISQCNIKRSYRSFAMIIFVLFTILLFLLNSLPLKYLPRSPQLYFQELKNMNFNFLYTYTSASGPTFGINFATLLLTFAAAFVFLFLSLFCYHSKHQHRRSMAHLFFVIFFSVSLSFNIFLVSEYLFHPTGVNVSDVKWKMISYVKDHHLSFPIYTNDKGIQWYFDHRFWHNPRLTMGFGDNEIDNSGIAVINRISLEGGTILLLDWPPLPENSPARDVVKQCRLQQQFYDKKMLVGEVYFCRK